MAEWITPIYDRTAQDVAQARLLQSDNTKDMKGAWNASDLNRIENNCVYMVEQLRKQGIIVIISTKTNWQMSDIPDYANITRIRNNIILLIKSFVPDRGYEDINMYQAVSYQDANILERDLLELKTLLENTIATYPMAGEYFAGELY